MLKDQLEISFYNTIDASGSELLKFQSDAKSQEDMVYELFVFKKVALAWFEVKAFYQDMNDCSIKRCLSNLKSKGKLFKTKIQVTGTEGKPCYKYELKPIN